MDYLIIFALVYILKISEGFSGQKSIVLPSAITEELSRMDFTRNLYVTDIGFYPDANLHYRERQEGCRQNILIYCSSGEGWLILNNRKHLIKAGEYVFIPAGVPHIYGANKHFPWTIYWLHFSGTQSDFFVSEGTEMIKKLPEGDIRDKFRLNLFNEVFHALEMGYSTENLEYSSICLMHFLASLKYPTQFNQAQIPVANDKVSISIQYMKQHLSEKISLNDIANEVKLSPSHFSLLFRKKTNRSPMDYLIHLRIQKACQFLDNTALQIKEIAVSTGFEDPYYFSRTFKKVMGKSPVNYRKMEKG